MFLLIQAVLLVTFGFFVFYLLLLSILALFKRSGYEKLPKRKRRFAFVIPAHNEEMPISATIRSILAVDYPQSQFDVVVVADNSTDRTAEIARAEGALVIERTDQTRRGKGFALEWAFEGLMKEQPGYDAFVVVDADSTVTPNFLDVMHYYLDNGAMALQCKDIVHPHPGAWSAEMTQMGFLLYNVARPLGRSLLGFSVGLRGNGMCFSRELLQKHKWGAYSQTEDLEFGLHLLVQGVAIRFAPEAIVYATMPTNPVTAESQRARWETGRLPIVRKYALPLFINALRKRSLGLIDALIDLATPPLINLMLMIFMLFIFTASTWVLGFEHAFLFTILWIVLMIGGLAHAIVGLVASKADENVYRSLIQIPRYALWKILLYTKLLKKGQTDEWVRTGRE